jgi:class 3 adenylate cyclase
VRSQSAGAITFLFTDLEGSTRLWERFPDAMKGALERHDAILRAAIEAAGGQVVKSTGDGLMAAICSPPWRPSPRTDAPTPNRGIASPSIEPAS